MPSQLSRRGFLAGSASLVAVLAALQARRSVAGTRASRFVPGPYGPLRPVADLETGLPLIYLPEGFEYRSYSWSGDPMSDGPPAPDAHDGMGVVAARGSGDDLEVTLVRNHERGFASPILAPARYDALDAAGPGLRPGRRHDDADVPRPALDGREALARRDDLQLRGRRDALGHLAQLRGNRDRPVREGRAAARLRVRSARGRRRDDREADRRHGPHAARGRRHRPGDGHRVPHGGRGLELRLLPLRRPRQARRPGQLRSGRPAAGRARRRPGQRGPARARGRRRPCDRVGGHRQSGCRSGQDAGRNFRDHRSRERAVPAGLGPGRARDEPRRRHLPSRREALSRRHRGGPQRGGPARATARARSGSTTRASRRCTAIFVAGSQQVGDNIDNITASPRGGLLLCENGDAVTDEYGTGTRLIGLTADGDSYAFAKNNIDLTLEEQVASGKRIFADYYRASEWAGACFEPGGEVLFVNIQVPGITFAIWGPWERGNL